MIFYFFLVFGVLLSFKSVAAHTHRFNLIHSFIVLNQICFCFLLLLGAERDGHVHNQPERVWFDVLLFQSTAGDVQLLPPRLGPRPDAVRPLPADALRTGGRLHLHRPGHHPQSIHHDRTPTSLSKVSLLYFYIRTYLLIYSGFHPSGASFALLFTSHLIIYTYLYAKRLKVLFDLTFTINYSS